MSSKIKGVILSVEDTLVRQGSGDGNAAAFTEVSKLIRFLQCRGIEFVVTTNRPWTVGAEKRPLRDVLHSHWGEFPYLSLEYDGNMPPRPQAAFTEYILETMGWTDTETIYIGSTEIDMRTAVNGGLLFLRATWYADHVDYGFQFSTPKNIARFLDVFCLREHLWGFEIKDGPFEFYALAPFSTMREDFKAYSMDAVAAAKHGLGHLDFWVGALVSSLYIAGIHKRIDYLAGYPGHKQNSGNAMERAMAIFGKCFRKKFLPDLILRHTTATKLQHARNAGVSVGHKNQLDTIQLNRAPLKSATARYTSSPLGRGKMILLVDDICTRGFSLESARTFIEQTGTGAIMVSWLKTINTNIERLAPFRKFDPYQPTTLEQPRVITTYEYKAHLSSRDAPEELDRMLKAYDKWDWPT
jgi:hypothetical protein